jgi:2-polyprenyl-3-methyl-5-hydroxy-6-metoxy-1,4-benzoquinol methylase
MKEKPPKQERVPVVIDDDDINEAYEKIAATAQANGVSRREFRPDDSILADQERTPNEEAARRDFETIRSALKEHSVDLLKARTLEIGSGMGELLKVLRKEGVDATGIDFNPREYYRPSRGDSIVLHAPLEALKVEKTGAFNVILARDVFDNDRYKLQVYKDMLAHIDTLLPSGGMFVKIGTGTFSKEEIPKGWKRVGGYSYEVELYQKR